MLSGDWRPLAGLLDLGMEEKLTDRKEEKNRGEAICGYPKAEQISGIE